MIRLKKIKTNTKTTKLAENKTFGWIDPIDPNIFFIDLTAEYFDSCGDDEMDGTYITRTGQEYHLYGTLSTLPHCCGIREVGDLSISKDFPQKLFNEFMKAFTSYYKGTTFIINTNNKNDSIIFERLLAKCPYFVDIKRFINKTSGNIITLWVSNNE
jgi:hypothetical protein